MLVAVFLLGAALAAAAGTPPPAAALLERAEAEFHKGISARGQPGQARKHFEAAWAAYEGLRRQGFKSVPLLGNEGSAALLAGNLPGAILAYRQALALDPGDRTLQQCLEYARDQVEYPKSDVRAAPEGWPAALRLPSDFLVLVLTIGCYALACIIFTRWLMIRRASFLVSGGLVLFLACAFGLLWWTRDMDVVQQEEHPLIVVKGTTPLRVGNGASYPPHHGLPSVRSGMEGQVQFVRGDWLQVEFPGGILGWLPRDRVLLDTTIHE